MKNAAFDTNDVKHCCENKLRISFRGEGKEYNGWVKINNKKFARITVSKGRKYIPPKTYKWMARQLKLTTEQFAGVPAQLGALRKDCCGDVGPSQATKYLF